MQTQYLTSMYEVEFSGDKVTELTANVISEFIYALCDANGNEHM